jgi:hypothetical protein
VAYWIDEDYQFKTALLALRPLEGHYGHQIADEVLPVIKSFRIEGQLGAFQTDNASNNDTALKVLAASIPGMNVKELRLRCFSHIVNLVVKAILYSDNKL